MHEVQFVFIFEQVKQGDWQAIHNLFSPIKVSGQGLIQVLSLFRFKVLHDVHFVAKSIHVAQSPIHGLAYPLSL
jgi:hypothetical protein